MNSVPRSLRIKLALVFAAFGATLILLLSFGLYVTTQRAGESLMDETLRAEIDGYLFRRSHNPGALLPNTVSIQGYRIKPGDSTAPIPPELVPLQEGTYELTLNDTPYRVAVTDKGDERYFMLFNEERQREREHLFLLYLTVGATIMIMLSAWLGWWLAGRVVAPISELARRVSIATPDDDADAVCQGFAHDEIGQLADVFSSYLKRMRAFIERERHFTSDVSHELRTPLAVMLSIVDILEEDHRLQDKQRERIARIAHTIREMADLTSALLLMSREDTGEPTLLACDVCEVVGAAIEANRHLLGGKTTTEFNCVEHPHIPANQTLLSIVVSNLIRNAFAHTPSGLVAITVEQRGLTVRDTGTGIRGDEIGKVFQRHFKGAGSTGSGIGLSLAKRICDRYGWEILITSTEGQGTSAQLIFPSTL